MRRTRTRRKTTTTRWGDKFGRFCYSLGSLLLCKLKDTDNGGEESMDNENDDLLKENKRKIWQENSSIFLISVRLFLAN